MRISDWSSDVCSSDLAPVGIDDQVRAQAGTRGLDQHVQALADTAAALGVADDPTHRIACRHRNQRLARLQGDTGDAAGTGIDLVPRAVAVGPTLQPIDATFTYRTKPPRQHRRQ